ncbi:MAG TPA: DUF2892 domain-containing protein [Polyangiaceae bacterium]|jgi:hypothetical protein|nr:DUF2892 domain-containing protein [Polyangiaceae bacterium]
MKRNMSSLEAGLRSGVGMLLLASPLLNLHTYPLSLLGAVLVATGVASVCPLYSLFGFTAPGTPRAHSRA